jgi:protein-tyrosine phosphatase
MSLTVDVNVDANGVDVVDGVDVERVAAFGFDHAAMAAADARIGADRLVALEAVHNFRDMGGYVTADGRHVRARRLFRADGLDRLTPTDVDTLRPLGLHTVIDLRTDGEIERRGRFPFEALPVDWYHLSVIDVTWDRTDALDGTEEDYLYAQYKSMLAYGEPRFLEAFLVLGLPGAFPAVFHCAAGKDRTGLLAALLLGALGVDDATITHDYELTRAGMDRMRAWALTKDTEMAEAVRTMPRHFGAVAPGAVARLLADIHHDHGSVREYVRSLGVPTDTLDGITAQLLV